MPANAPIRTTSVDLFTPKFVTVLREGYGLAEFRRDAVAGLTVAIVALPLSMAIAIASGTTPDRGIYTAIVGGFIVSALGGSRFQIGGPAGAFIVLVASIIERHGYEGLALATMMAGILMLATGFLRLGTYIKFIPYPVTVGFTAGIATIIMASQIKDFLGITLAHEPAALLPKLDALRHAAGTWSGAAVTVSLGSVGVILAVRRLRPRWPAFLIGVAAASLIAPALGIDVATIGSRFGAVPTGLPAPHLPALSPGLLLALLPDAAAIAILGSIESLLSAVVADGMTGRRHRSNCELVAQGVANLASGLFGGICVTGTIARTATNVRAGAHGPVAGMLHAAYILGFMVFGAPLIALVPLPALAAILVVVAWNMAERHAFACLVRASAGDRAVLLATFLLTIFVDLMTGIAVGVTMSALLFMHRMATEVAIEDSGVDDAPDGLEAVPPGPADREIIVYRISGPLFFGAVAITGSVLDRIGEHPRIFVLDLSRVPFVDSTGAATLGAFAGKLEAGGTRLVLACASPGVLRTLASHRLAPPRVGIADSVEQALAEARIGMP